MPVIVQVIASGGLGPQRARVVGIAEVEGDVRPCRLGKAEEQHHAWEKSPSHKRTPEKLEVIFRVPQFLYTKWSSSTNRWLRLTRLLRMPVSKAEDRRSSHCLGRL